MEERCQIKLEKCRYRLNQNSKDATPWKCHCYGVQEHGPRAPTASRYKTKTIYMMEPCEKYGFR